MIGGRSSAKSESTARVLLMRLQTEAADVLCGREYQNSIEDSVHKLIKTLITKLRIPDFGVTDKRIECLTGGEFKFRGFARNSDAVKSAQDFKYCWIEEAQSLSQKSIDDLLPTIRAANSQLFFTANPQSSADPFSKRFINPFLKDLHTKGFYEDNMHLIIMANWRDNPWHEELEDQRLWDKENLSRAKYDHIWEGAFNDSVENPLILAEWFDACIDAHKVLGIKPQGLRLSSHDPSDEGEDSKSFAFRHGSILLDLQEMTEGDVNEGGDWATGLAINHESDGFNWDADGLGVGLNRQIQAAFQGKKTSIQMFKGSKSPKFPDVIYEPVELTQRQKTNKEAFKNRRAQFYFMLRDRILRTFRAVIKHEYHDPDDMISFDSNIKILQGLRSELCRMPIKPNPNGTFQLYSKDELKKRFKFASPNLADAVMMLMDVPSIEQSKVHVPRPIQPMGITNTRNSFNPQSSQIRMQRIEPVGPLN
jgi:phage terminase large subunit